MLRRRNVFAVLFLIATSAAAQQTIYWKKDHIYFGPGGKEIAVFMPAPTDQTAPTVPSSVTTSNQTSNSVQINWGASTDSGGSGLAGYKVYRQRGSGARLPVGTVGPSTLSFTDQPLQAGNSYTYTVVAFDKAQNHSAASNAVTVNF